MKKPALTSMSIFFTLLIAFTNAAHAGGSDGNLIINASASDDDYAYLNYPIWDGTYSKCETGAIQIFSEFNGDENVPVKRVCTNGSWMTAAEKAAYNKALKNTPKKCKEGQQAIWSTKDINGDNSKGLYECTKGKYVLIQEL